MCKGDCKPGGPWSGKPRARPPAWDFAHEGTERIALTPRIPPRSRMIRVMPASARRQRPGPPISSNLVGHVRTTEASLLARCQQGDVAAFEELYRQHATRLYSLAYRMVGSTSEAEDLLQEIFLLAYRKLRNFRGESALATWLYRLAMNQCLDHLRSKAAKMADATVSLEHGPSNGPRIDPPAPEEMTVSRLDLERAVARLPEGCRAAFVLHDVEGFGHHEIAEILGIADGTSRSQVHKARLRLRELLTGTVQEPLARARP